MYLGSHFWELVPPTACLIPGNASNPFPGIVTTFLGMRLTNSRELATHSWELLPIPGNWYNIPGSSYQFLGISTTFLGIHTNSWECFLLQILRTCTTCTLILLGSAFGRAVQERHAFTRNFHLDDRTVFRGCPMEREAAAVAHVLMLLPFLAPRHRLQASAALVL